MESAADEGFADIIKMLIDKGVKVTDGVFDMAIESGQVDAVKMLCKACGKITADSIDFWTFC